MELTEEQQMIQETARRFAESEVQPIAAEIDQMGKYPLELIEKMGGMGFLGLVVPAEYGGTGTDTVCYSIVIEELSRVCGSTGLSVAAHNSLGSAPICIAGTEEQKSKYLPEISSGEAVAAFGLTEPQAGSDASRTQTRAVLKGDKYILNGTKVYVTNGGHARYMVMTAMTQPEKGVHGISAFIVHNDFPGFKIGTHEKKLGVRASSTTEIVFEDCEVPKENLLGNEGEGFKIFMQTLDGGRISIGAMALGIAQGAMEAAIAYAKERHQFGKPISEFQAIQNMIADMATEIRAARLMVYDTSRLKDEGKPFSAESAMCKLFASTMAMKVTTNALQIHGGYGYFTEYPVERYYRDAKLTEIGEGTSEIQRLVIARSILKD
ncbi:MAG: acyl-CoA dehydrogenase [Candidatus Latescibacteria bacterium]|nr:acyl-CoA dehydrogenase [Candidatus Latescibacterota bacterium]NIM22127.1 acyl-CoA dehydrogenase [Candidatus Latescibacterota bacterium]NIM64677.1 acyl-CoA dehydrogenase [Candidatus Latescibacterota bacterium]NIO01187.1 acyl-CoA dehydrogenase [Candidatus Latescibacterota bacterium]NIO27572.1 acyl-CoA dehydrogenase [Candidatus Latescibacterota bacterium]